MFVFVGVSVTARPSSVGLPLGLAGAVQATRYVGATTSGAPVSGTFAVGDFVIDRTGYVIVCVTAGSPGTWTSTRSRRNLALAARGLIEENLSLELVTGSTTIASGVVYGFLLGLHAGDVVSNVVLAVNVGAAGSVPTLARFGIADSTGKILARSADLGAVANWGAAAQRGFALSYTVPTDGGYIICFIVNGTWGTTQPTIARTQPQNAYPVYGANAPYQFQWSGQTDLPAVNSSLTMSTGAGTGYWVGVA